jgi:hypothetical protein
VPRIYLFILFLFPNFGNLQNEIKHPYSYILHLSYKHIFRGTYAEVKTVKMSDMTCVEHVITLVEDISFCW